MNTLQGEIFISHLKIGQLYSLAVYMKAKIQVLEKNTIFPEWLRTTFKNFLLYFIFITEISLDNVSA